MVLCVCRSKNVSTTRSTTHSPTSVSAHLDSSSWQPSRSAVIRPVLPTADGMARTVSTSRALLIPGTMAVTASALTRETGAYPGSSSMVKDVCTSRTAAHKAPNGMAGPASPLPLTALLVSTEMAAHNANPSLSGASHPQLGTTTGASPAMAAVPSVLCLPAAPASPTPSAMATRPGTTACCSACVLGALAGTARSAWSAQEARSGTYTRAALVLRGSS